MSERIAETEGHNQIKLLRNDAYDNAIIGITADGRAVYDYENMIAIGYMLAEKSETLTFEIARMLINKAIVNIDQNDQTAPIIVYPIEYPTEAE